MKALICWQEVQLEVGRGGYGGGEGGEGEVGGESLLEKASSTRFMEQAGNETHNS